MPKKNVFFFGTFFFKKGFCFQNEPLCMLWFSLFPFDYGSDETDGNRQVNVTVTDSVALCSIFNSTNRIEPVFLAPFRLYCKLVRRPGQGCSSAPWAPCRMQHSYRSFTVHHGVWFWLAGFHSNAAATGSLLGGRSSAGGTMSLFLSPSGNRFYDFSHTNNDFV